MARRKRKMASPATRSVSAPETVSVTPPAVVEISSQAEQALGRDRQSIQRDNPVPVGKPLPSPGIPDSWVMRPGAEELNTSQLHTGPETTYVSLQALMATNEPAYLFQRYGRLASVVPDEHGLPAIADVSQGALRGYLSRAAHWKLDVKLRSGEIETRSTLPPGYVVADIASHGDWPLPAPRGISPIPVLRSDGSLHTTPGYDHKSGYWYEPGGILAGRHFSIPDPIAAQDIQQAARVLDDWLVDFPFAGPAEKAHAIVLSDVARTVGYRRQHSTSSA